MSFTSVAWPPRRAPEPDRNSTTAWTNVDWCVVVSLVVLTAVLGALRVGDSSLWIDEGATAAIVHRSFGGTINMLRYEAGSGPYYAVLRAWSQITFGAVWLRAFSVLGGMATVALSYVFARRVVARTPVALGVFALVCHPTFLRYLTEARSYAWCMFFGVLTTGLALRCATAFTRRHAVTYAIAAGLLLAINIFSVSIIGVQVLVIWYRTRRAADARTTYVIVLAVMAVIVAPFVATLLTSDQLSWVPPLSPQRFVGQTATFASRRIGAVLYLGIALLALRWWRGNERRLRDAQLLVVCSAVAMPVGLAVLALIKPVFLTRYMTPALPLLVIGGVCGLWQWGTAQFGGAHGRSTKVVSGAIVVMALVGFPGVPWRDEPHGEDFRSASQFLAANVAPDDGVQFSPMFLRIATSYYWYPNPSQVIGFAPHERNDVRVHELTQAEADAQAATHCRIWRMDLGAVPAAVAAGWQQRGERTETTTFRLLTVTRVDRC